MNFYKEELLNSSLQIGVMSVLPTNNNNNMLIIELNENNTINKNNIC